MKKFLKMNAASKVEFALGGQLISNEPWAHMKRTIDNYEVIIGVKNTLYLEVEGTKYEVQPGDVLIIPPHQFHGGYSQCKPGVSFYWFHFYCSQDIALIDEKTMDHEVKLLRANPYAKHSNTSIFLPIFSTPRDINRINILCHQLLDVANSNYYNPLAVDYLATVLLIELSEQTLTHFHSPSETGNIDKTITKIMEWIRVNAMSDISVQSIAENFNYSRNYLSRIFKSHTGMNIKDYIHMLKISKAKDLLIRSNSGIKGIALSVGIDDEKYFMRLFKKYEKMTPTEYRKAYYRIPLNLD
ncbi:AraC family transcriptional regulator [Marinicrinis lubricantis]|uniref:AraC family transcriptional regulator n=1 Tax=Marinicrinis lubricantis TaxID=2086470 RepID=A0ABW1IR07_9BACL